MIADVNLLIERLDSLEQYLVQYSKLTAALSSIDIELADEIDDIIEQRETVIDEIKLINPQITELIDRQTPEKAAAIRKMLAGETVLSQFTDDEKAVQTKIITLLSLQKDITEKDRVITGRFRAGHDEARRELEKMQKEKKNLSVFKNYTLSDGEKGKKFDFQN